MPIIHSLRAQAWKAIVFDSNTNAMKKTHKYPLFEKAFFESCLDYVDTNCNADCFCKTIHNQGAWVIKADLKFDTFLEHYANLWARGQFNTLSNMLNHQYFIAEGRYKNLVPVLRVIKLKWNNWDGQGNSLAKLANQYKYTHLCDGSFEKIQGLVEQIKELCSVDTTGVYTSKLISQLFPDIAVPFDTASSQHMTQDGYNSLSYGKSMKTDIKKFIQSNNLSMREFRALDNAPSQIWESQPKLNGEFTSCSRVIDKLFYK